MTAPRLRTGSFFKQPFYTPAKIETICTDELRNVHLYPSDPVPIRIDRFIEKRFGVLPSYEDLPNGLLGFTRFDANGVDQIVVSKALDEEGTVAAERRLRTTLAHEVGHGLLHAHLFALDASSAVSLFENDVAQDAAKILCRDDGTVLGSLPARKPPFRWWEYQANQAMGAILMPHGLVQKAIAPMLVPQGVFGISTVPYEWRDHSVRLLADIFDVNPIVARIRLDKLYPAGGEQLTF